MQKITGRERSFRQTKGKLRQLLAVRLCAAHFSRHKKRTMHFASSGRIGLSSSRQVSRQVSEQT
ncbi:hypothetical protein GCWU000325_00748 [Alloprevotella tannerae ATCC 51259]|uniref:Uncharacterized protein n=1 Tax=Alloprevotella tannerae ATCC 51259 TaxID=626522 RepID=C9LEW7_9BACT|nr:hypothetical protein GCWU000325_00748 [Alloprevotella tannerae ATCC 51259]